MPEDTVIEPAATTEPVTDPVAEPPKTEPAKLETPITEPAKTTEPTAEVTPPVTEPTKTTEPVTTDPKTTEPTVEGAPEKYDLKLGENSLLDAGHLADIESFGKANNLTQEALQGALVEREAELVKEVEVRSNAWLEEVKKDPGMGGDNFNTTIEHARRAVERLDTNGKLKPVLDRFGYGNQPEIIRAFASIGAQMEPAPVRMGAPGGRQGNANKSAASVLYGETKEK